MSVSAKELAEKLNISAATVSMVLNNKPGISENTRKKVLSAAHELGFDFSKLEAKSSSYGSIQLVIYKNHGIVVTDTPFFSQLVESIEQGCRNEGFSLQITYFNKANPPEDQLKNIKKTDSDGILLLGTEMQLADFEPFLTLSTPLVVLDTYFNELEYDFVTINNRRGMSEATKELVSKGFDEIGYLHSSYEIVNFNERAEGYFKTLKKHNVETKKEFIHLLTPSIEGAYEDMKKLLDNGCTLAKAYVADNDLIAAGAMRAFKEYGLKIPEDISLIGFDNMPICDILEPALTTVDVPKKSFGLLALSQLIRRMQNKDEACLRTEISPKLCIKKSVI